MPHNAESNLILSQCELLSECLKENYGYLEIASWCLTLDYFPLLTYITIIREASYEKDIYEKDIQTILAEETVQAIWRACILDPVRQRRKTLIERTLECVLDSDKQMCIYAEYYER